MRLDRRYFDHVATNPHNGIVLQSYKAVHARSTMVLFSRRSRTPLAALTLTPKDVGCLSMLTSRPPPERATQPHFQGMLSMPDQSFSFVITNLSDGMINFNVLHSPHRVSEVNPGPSYGVNEVNELQPGQSYEIEADQRTGRAMVLKGKTEEKVDTVTRRSRVVPLTVHKSESTKDKAKKGLYFYLSVVPDVASTISVNKFKEGTVWKAVSGFVLTIQPPPEPLMRPCRIPGRIPPDLRFYPSPPLQPYGGEFGTPSLTSSENEGPVGCIAPAPPRIMPQSSRAADLCRCADYDGRRHAASHSLRSARPANDYGWLSKLLGREAESKSKAADLGEGMKAYYDENVERWIFPGDDSTHEVAGAAMTAELTRLRPQMAAGAPAGSLPPLATAGAPVVLPPPAGDGGASFAAKVDVGTTQAGELAYGERVQVSSRRTGHAYAYEDASEPTVLCMSIWEDMKFLPLLDTVEKMLEAEVKEWIENKGKALIASLNVISVYKEDRCVIDLESEADTIVCTCGHQCINHANAVPDLRRCPLCRSPITAFVRADGIVI